MDRALPCGGRGRGFESPLAYHFPTLFSSQVARSHLPDCLRREIPTAAVPGDCLRRRAGDSGAGEAAMERKRLIVDRFRRLWAIVEFIAAHPGLQSGAARRAFCALGAAASGGPERHPAGDGAAPRAAPGLSLPRRRRSMPAPPGASRRGDARRGAAPGRRVGRDRPGRHAVADREAAGAVSLPSAPVSRARPTARGGRGRREG